MREERCEDIQCTGELEAGQVGLITAMKCLHTQSGWSERSTAMLKVTSRESLNHGKLGRTRKGPYS
jgi:hypothetical protein